MGYGEQASNKWPHYHFIQQCQGTVVWDRLVYQKVLRLLNMSNIAAKLLDTNRIHQSKKTSETTNHKARIQQFLLASFILFLSSLDAFIAPLSPSLFFWKLIFSFLSQGYVVLFLSIRNVPWPLPSTLQLVSIEPPRDFNPLIPPLFSPTVSLHSKK